LVHVVRLLLRDSNATVGCGRCRNFPKNAVGQKQDAGWQHGISVDGDPKILSANIVIIVSNGVYRFKQQPACTKKNDKECSF